MSLKSIGYDYVRQFYQIRTPPHYRSSSLSQRSAHQSHYEKFTETHTYPSVYDPGEALVDHLEFALKYEGLDLALFFELFQKVDANEWVQMIQEKPLGQYRRRIWFLYEYLTGKTLPLPDLKVGNYVALADDAIYFTRSKPARSPRHKVEMNLFGTKDFIPLLRKTAKILSYQEKQLDRTAKATIGKYPAELLARAISYLYTKETKASFQIEHEQPDHSRAERFIGLLRQAERKSFLNKESLTELQNAIVDSRFGAQDYRNFQNYVGETHGFGKEKIHFVCPQPQDVESLMKGLLETCQQLTIEEFDPVLFAAIASFGFVFIHPFEDGNGRIHRFLIHNILALYSYTPEGVIFPISASMLQQMRKYDDALESFSSPRLSLVDYTLDDDGEMRVKGSTKVLYQFIDFSYIAERLYEFVEDTVLKQLPEELSFLARYDATRRAMRAIVDMPDRLIDLFIKVCTTNHGKLSKAKRASAFAKLSDAEIRKLEEAFRQQHDPFARDNDGS